MPKVLRGKKYEHMVRFLTETMNDPKVKHRTRMQAALKLQSVYERLDKYSEADARRRAKRLQVQQALAEGEALTMPLDSEEGVEAEEDARIQGVFADILKKPEGESAEPQSQ